MRRHRNAAQRPDVLLLQEVDRDSARTARIDELARLRRLGHWSCWTSAPYHRSRYVPVPVGNALGQVGPTGPLNRWRNHRW